jgi:hypothetical protein
MPTGEELFLLALSWAMVAFTLFIAFRNGSGTPR